jgi:nucleotide-binding universal stress UspA family protein
MMNASLTKILLATDGSRDAALAMRAAADVSCKTGAQLHVVHVIPDVLPPSNPGSTIFDEDSRQAEEEARELLRKQGWQARVDGGEVAGEHLREGRPAHEINTLAEELNVDLVVVGSRGAGWVKRLVTGSVSEDLVHRASCPVLIVRGREDAWPPTRVVVGDDGSEVAARADVLAAEIASLFGAEVLLVRAYENPPEPVGGWSAQDRCELDEALSRRREDLDERAEQLAELTHRRIGTRLTETKPVHAMSWVAGKRDEGRTLLAVGSRGLGALNRVLSGSVSTKVLRAAQGPVLVVPSENVSTR